MISGAKRSSSSESGVKDIMNGYKFKQNACVVISDGGMVDEIVAFIAEHSHRNDRT